jgi:hypothetical protein
MDDQTETAIGRREFVQTGIAAAVFAALDLDESRFATQDEGAGASPRDRTSVSESRIREASTALSPSRGNDISVRDSLERIHWWSQNRDTSSSGLASGTATWPSSGSLREALRATVSPEIGSWTAVVDTQISDEWAPGCQGIAFRGARPYVTQNESGAVLDNAKKGIYKLERDWDTKKKTINKQFSKKFKFHGGNHWGDLDIHDGIVYVAVENENRVVEVDPDSLSVIASNPLEPPRELRQDDPSKNYPHGDGDFPWCAINQWNGYLYTSNFGDVTAIYAYDPDDDYRRVPEATISLHSFPGDSFKGIQGGSFSANGHLYLSSFTSTHKTDPGPHSWEQTADESDWLFAFDALGGSYMGRQRLKAAAGKKTGLETEGMTVQPGLTYEDNGTASVHTVILDRNIGRNSIQLKAFSLPSGAML